MEDEDNGRTRIGRHRITHSWLSYFIDLKILNGICGKDYPLMLQACGIRIVLVKLPVSR